MNKEDNMNSKNRSNSEVSLFEIYEYDNNLKEFSSSSIGFGSGQNVDEACQNFAKETGWSSKDNSKFLWAKYPICS
jgi:hypothetical protein